jgi:hypothetical protein
MIENFSWAADGVEKLGEYSEAICGRCSINHKISVNFLDVNLGKHYK